MMLELIVAATVGITFANTWMCVLLTLGAAAEGVDASKYFIVGRFVGVVAIGLLISSFRLALQEYMAFVFLAFGILSIAFGAIIIARQYLEKRYKDRLKAEGTRKDCSSCVHAEAHGRTERKKGLFRSSCGCGLFSPIGSSCDHDHDEQGGCASWTPTEEATNSSFGARYGFALGLFRGATPCAKILLLAPLLIVVDLPVSLLLIIVYAGTSSVYPAIGFMSARLLSRIKGRTLLIRTAGAMVILAVGIFSILKFILYDGSGCFN
jgi:ABC-type nickel/cobalt efflux system permease component RcnA